METAEAKVPEFKFSGVPMTEEQSGQFMMLVLNKNKDEVLSAKSEITGQSALIQIFLKRIEAYKLPFKVSEMFMIMSLMTFVDRPGNVMILLRLCYQYYMKTKTEMLGISEWAELFPMGVPSDKELEQMWDSQKSRGGEFFTGNMLDNPKVWEIEK